jgi:hypothetical protein
MKPKLTLDVLAYLLEFEGETWTDNGYCTLGTRQPIEGYFVIENKQANTWEVWSSERGHNKLRWTYQTERAMILCSMWRLSLWMPRCLPAITKSFARAGVRVTENQINCNWLEFDDNIQAIWRPDDANSYTVFVPSWFAAPDFKPDGGGFQAIQTQDGTVYGPYDERVAAQIIVTALSSLLFD